jgi:putative transcriptional regulator
VRRALALGAMTVLALGLLVRTAGPASENGSTPPGAGGLAGQFLVASEDMGDPRFAQTVILMVRHDAGGAMGIIVNRPMAEVPAARLLEGVGLDPAGVRGDIRLHYGGPVDRRQVLTLHTSDYTTNGTVRVGREMGMTGNPEILRAIGTGTGPTRFLVALGYAGWAPGQLEAEMRAGGWFNVPADETLTFDANHERKWERAKARRRIEL